MLIYHALLLPQIYFLIKICGIIAYTELHVPKFVQLTSPGRFQSFILWEAFTYPQEKRSQWEHAYPRDSNPLRVQIYATQIPQWKTFSLSELQIKAWLQLMLSGTEETGNQGFLQEPQISIQHHLFRQDHMYHLRSKLPSKAPKGCFTAVIFYLPEELLSCLLFNLITEGFFSDFQKLNCLFVLRFATCTQHVLRRAMCYFEPNYLKYDHWDTMSPYLFSTELANYDEFCQI